MPDVVQTYRAVMVRALADILVRVGLTPRERPHVAHLLDDEVAKAIRHGGTDEAKLADRAVRNAINRYREIRGLRLRAARKQGAVLGAQRRFKASQKSFQV